jgi:hypothetical protein
MTSAPSSFSRFFDENYNPQSDRERRQIMDTIEDHQTAIARLDHKLRNLQPSNRTPDDLLARKTEHEEGLEKHRSLLAPVLKLPDDVLGEIASWLGPSSTPIEA